MVKTSIGFFTALFTILLVSCPLFEFDTSSLNILDANSFYAQNLVTGKSYKVKADNLYEGKKCVIWAEKGSGVTKEMAKEIANEYDTVIRSRIVEKFGMKKFSVSNGRISYNFDDILDYANWLAGRTDKKLTILLLDIKDGFKDPKTDSFTAGYFWSGNFLPKGKIPGYDLYSNGIDMIYVDTYPGLSMKRTQTYATFAHELQHLINYVTTIRLDRDLMMDTWIDEGLSSQAEYFYLEENPAEKISWFVLDEAETIAKGNTFFVWGNHSDIPNSILDDYATVYLFFRWLYLQADEDHQSHIFYDIITSDFTDYQAVTAAAQQINASWDSWEPLLKTWFAANYDPKNSQYGYKGDNYLQTGDGEKFDGLKVTPIGGSIISLYPGEGVYSIIENPFSPSAAAGTNIRYAGLSSNGITIDDTSAYSGDMLLTFNANTNNKGSRSIGQLTNVTPHVTVQSSSRSLMGTTFSGVFTGPYVKDARDILGRDHENDKIFLKILRDKNE